MRIPGEVIARYDTVTAVKNAGITVAEIDRILGSGLFFIVDKPTEWKSEFYGLVSLEFTGGFRVS